MNFISLTVLLKTVTGQVLYLTGGVKLSTIALTVLLKDSDKLPISHIIRSIHKSKHVPKNETPKISLKPFIFKKDLINYANKIKPLKI